MRIYTDGSYRDGVGGWGWWCPETKKFGKGFEEPSTNQRMELMAALEALNVYYDEKDITIVSDSKYLVDCFGEKWWITWVENGWVGSHNKKEISNRDIWEPLLELVRQHGNIKFEWIKGHSGDPDNDKADELANGARINRERGVPEISHIDAVIETPLKIGENRCSYCKEKPVTHFFLMRFKKFLAACEKHRKLLREPLLLSTEVDEHPWHDASCNVQYSYWCVPIDKEEESTCMEVH